MMLNTDLCMVFKNLENKTLLAPNDKKCCTWMEHDDVKELFPSFTDSEPYCGTTLGSVNEDTERTICCSDNLDCDSNHIGSGPARQWVFEFINSENAFLLGYLEAWLMATENSYTSLTAIGDGTRLLKDDGSKNTVDYAAIIEDADADEGDLEIILPCVAAGILLIVGLTVWYRRKSASAKEDKVKKGPDVNLTSVELKQEEVDDVN